MLESVLENEMSFEKIRYSAVWEDPALLDESLEITADDDVLSIASAGCNVLHLLSRAPRSVTAIDLSVPQLALLELKLRAIENFNLDDFKILLGFGPGGEALALYRQVLPSLSAEAKLYWSRHEEEIALGLIHQGRLEQYFKKFREEYLQKIWPKPIQEKMLQARSGAEQWDILSRTDMNLFRQFSSKFFSRDGLAQNGRDPAQFKYVEAENIGEAFYRRFENLLRRSPISENYFLHFFVTGKYPQGLAAPTFLQESVYEKLKGLTCRVKIVNESLERHLSVQPSGTYSKANLSDIFEYMSADHAQSLFQILNRVLRRPGRIAFWNLLVDRCPDESRQGTSRLASLSHKLRLKDRLWFYQSFHGYELL